MMDIFSRLFFWRDKTYMQEEIQAALARGHKHGLLDSSTREMMDNILAFRNVLVREIMIPRTEIVSVSADATIYEITQEIMLSRHTRIPMYRGNIDNIVGIMNIKDLLRFCSNQNDNEDLLKYLTKPYYIPETKNAQFLLHEFRENKKHLAIVIDEYGGTSGLVTIEDLLEEIVGDIHDEHEITTPDNGISKLIDGSVMADGRTEIEIIEECLQITLERGRYETLSGLILNAIRRIPITGENFQIEGLNIIIENADERSIKKVKIKKMDSNSLHEK
jgi:magnesium and cobalt transporter